MLRRGGGDIDGVLPPDSRCSISILQKSLLKELESSNILDQMIYFFCHPRSCMFKVNNISREIVTVVCTVLLDVFGGPS